jgi:DNA-binding transcriptional ArsR family regulator
LNGIKIGSRSSRPARKFQKIFKSDVLAQAVAADILNQMVKQFPKSLNRVFFALSDPTRRAILARVADGEMTITALATPFAISFVAVSKHVRVLETAGLLKRSKQGREFHLRLVAEPLQNAAQWLDQYDRFWTDQLHHIKARAEQKAREKGTT